MKTVENIIEKNNIFEVKLLEKANEQILMCSTSLFGFISFINHARNINTKRHFVGPTLHIIRASKDIKAGDEIFIDYAQGATTKKDRNEILHY